MKYIHVEIIQFIKKIFIVKNLFEENSIIASINIIGWSLCYNIQTKNFVTLITKQ